MKPVGLIPFFVVVGWLSLVAPIPAVLLLSPNPAAYLRYGAVVQLREGATAAEGFRLFAIGTSSHLALLGFFVVYWVRTRYARSAVDPVRWLAFFLVLIPAWIHGKRSYVIEVLTIIALVNFFERRLRLRTVLIYVALVVVGSYFYIGLAKGIMRTPLEYVRGDLARDYTLRHVIHRSGWTASSLVPYRGAPYVFTMAAYVPRKYWTSKPWPAPVYLTCDVFNRRVEDRLGWGFGMGFMEELIMSFGYLGILGCLLIGRISSWLDHFIYSRSSYYALLWVPLIFGCAFASSAILTLIVFLVAPALLLSPFFADRRAWLPVYPEGPRRLSSAGAPSDFGTSSTGTP
jgi:hypothetical protein